MVKSKLPVTTGFALWDRIWKLFDVCGTAEILIHIAIVVMIMSPSLIIRYKYITISFPILPMIYAAKSKYIIG